MDCRCSSSRRIEANLFFTFFGLDAIHKKRWEHIKVAAVGNPGLHFATLAGGLPGVSSVMTHYMERKMDKLDIPHIPEFIEMIADTGAGLYGCKASVDLFELTKDDLIEQVKEIITMGEFYGLAAGGQIIFTCRLITGQPKGVVEGLTGRVVEIGFGSGLNVDLYPPRVDRVYAVEPAEVARRLAEKRVEKSSITIQHFGLNGQPIPLASESCDSALSPFTLCTIRDVQRVLTEVHRVMRPGARFHFLERGLSSDRRVARVASNRSSFVSTMAAT